jgi:hypothetical protein
VAYLYQARAEYTTCEVMFVAFSFLRGACGGGAEIRALGWESVV